MNATVGSTVQFHCQAAVSVNAVAWYINHAPMNRLNSPNIIHITEPDASWSHALHTLQMPALEEYNNSIVQCVIIIFGSPDIFSKEVTLAVQGTLQFVMYKLMTVLLTIQVNWQQCMISTLLTMESIIFTYHGKHHSPWILLTVIMTSGIPSLSSM